MSTAHEQHYDQDLWNGNPSADEAYAKAMEAIENDPCLDCGEPVPTLEYPNLSPWGDTMGYFCNDDCHARAGEAQDQRRMEEV